MVAALANDAMMRLLTDPDAPDEGWLGGSAVMAFNVVAVNNAAYLITPRNVARLILMDVCQKPIFIRNGFYEYLRFGRGLEPKQFECNCSSPLAAYERDNSPTLQDFPATPQFVRIYPTNQSDAGRRVVIQGADQNGMPVLGVDSVTQQAIEGESLFLQFPFVQTANQFTGPLGGIIKDTTLGQVTFFAVDPVSGAQTTLSTMQPNETTASYRRYLINGLPANCCNSTTGQIQVSAQAKLDFVPVASDSDTLFLPNIPAILEEIASQKYSFMDAANAPALQSKHHATALKLLNGQLDHVYGKINTAIRVSLWGSDRLRPQPI